MEVLSSDMLLKDQVVVLESELNAYKASDSISVLNSYLVNWFFITNYCKSF